MARFITVKGVGKVTLKPDLAVLTLSIKTKNKDYSAATQEAENKLCLLTKALENAGLDVNCVKTTGYDVFADYVYEQDSQGNSRKIFDGYVCTHGLKLEVDFPSDFLEKAINAISESLASPKLNIEFTVKDRNAVNEQLLAAIAENATSKAEILCRSFGATLGELQSIDYNWSDINLHSNAAFLAQEGCCIGASSCVSINPEKISVSDHATFVWKIESK